METHEYLLNYGVMGDFGRFRPTTPLSCRRGDRVVVKSWRGVELGVVLCAATPEHAHFLPNTTVGKLLRLATSEDEARAEARRDRAQQLFAEAQALATELALPLEVLDAELTLDGKQAVLHHLPGGTFDERELISRLSKRFELAIMLHSLALPAEEVEPEEDHEHGCGKPNCGKTEGGGCSTCSTGGGCSSCGDVDLKSYFGGLREQMVAANRTPLL